MPRILIIGLRTLLLTISTYAVLEVDGVVGETRSVASVEFFIPTQPQKKWGGLGIKGNALVPLPSQEMIQKAGYLFLLIAVKFTQLSDVQVVVGKDVYLINGNGEKYDGACEFTGELDTWDLGNGVTQKYTKLATLARYLYSVPRDRMGDFTFHFLETEFKAPNRPPEK